MRAKPIVQAQFTIFMKLVRRRNNPNKETIKYIPFISRHSILSVYNPNCKMTWRIAN